MQYWTSRCCGLFLGNSLVLLYSCSSGFSKMPNPKSTNLAGSLDGAPIHRHFITSKTKTLSRDRSIIQHFTHTTGIRCFLSIHRLQRDCDCDSHTRCAAAVKSHNTTPPTLIPRRGLIPRGGRHMVASERQAQKMFFWTSTCAGYRTIIVVETHTLRYSTWYTCRQRLIHTPCSNLPRLCLGGSCRRQLRQAHCTGATHSKAVGTSKYHSIGHSYLS